MADLDLTELAAKAADGDRDALEVLCRETQHLVYRLSLRFYSSRPDAEDVTQDIMVKVITNLGSFEGRAKFTTWVYTIASRHLLASKRKLVEDSVAGAEPFGKWLDANLGGSEPEVGSDIEYRELCSEIRLGCTHGMLLCLTRDHRIAYLLGDLVGFSAVEAADVLEITPATFRQRLARARRTMRSVIENRCGLLVETNPCRCEIQIRPSISAGILDPNNLAFTKHPGVDTPVTVDSLRRATGQLDKATAIAEIFLAQPDYADPDKISGPAPTYLPLEDGVQSRLGAGDSARQEVCAALSRLLVLCPGPALACLAPLSVLLTDVLLQDP
ncbi:MAG: RNA polymerase sigma factor [Actinobacteria bacterium]|nr:RNA polymerase sigma factor [Actinomycetota bacterium]